MLALIGLVLFSMVTFVHADDPTVYSAQLKRGVLRYDKAHAQDGYNLVETDIDHPECRIYDMNGRYVYSVPGKICHILPDGRILSALGDDEFAFFNPDLSLIWKKPLWIHHDMDVSESTDEIAYLGKTIRRRKNQLDLYLDFLEIVGFNGKRKFIWRFEDHLKEMSKVFGIKIVPYPYNEHRDLTIAHLNSVEIIPKGHPITRIPGFEAGNILMADFHHSQIFVINRKGHVTWNYHAANGSFKDRRGVHAAKLTARGTILFFKNRGAHGNKEDSHGSSIVELDPRTKQEKVIYKSAEREKFFSKYYGSVSELANGNFLVTHITSGGSAFEVDAHGKIVWEWMTPLNNQLGKPIEVYRVTRLPRKPVERILDAAGLPY